MSAQRPEASQHLLNTSQLLTEYLKLNWDHNPAWKNELAAEIDRRFPVPNPQATLAGEPVYHVLQMLDILDWVDTEVAGRLKTRVTAKTVEGYPVILEMDPDSFSNFKQALVRSRKVVETPEQAVREVRVCDKHTHGCVGSGLHDCQVVTYPVCTHRDAEYLCANGTTGCQFGQQENVRGQQQAHKCSSLLVTHGKGCECPRCLHNRNPVPQGTEQWIQHWKDKGLWVEPKPIPVDPKPTPQEVFFVKMQSAQEFLKMAIPALLGAGWTCLDVHAYKDGPKSLKRTLWKRPAGQRVQVDRPLAIDEAYTEFDRVELDKLLSPS